MKRIVANQNAYLLRFFPALLLAAFRPGHAYALAPVSLSRDFSGKTAAQGRHPCPLVPCLVSLPKSGRESATDKSDEFGTNLMLCARSVRVY